MNHSSIWRRAGLGLVALALSLSLQACGSTGQARGKIVIPVPFSDDIRIEFFVSTTGEKHFDVNAGPVHAGKCFKITWFDEDGNELGVTEGTTDDNGFDSGPVPDDAMQFRGKLAPCPKPDSGKGASASKMLEPPVDGGVVTARSRPSTDLAESRYLTDFLVFGGPLVPSDDPGKDNLTFAFQVFAENSAQVEALLDPILQGGIGSPLPPAVEVLRWTTMEATPSGSRLTTALPGQYVQWSFDLNDGSFTADLLNNVTRYGIGGWDVVETNIPFSAFDQGIAPGVVYDNHGVLSHRTDLMPATKTIHDGFEYSN